jgi:hypothetical protein
LAGELISTYFPAILRNVNNAAVNKPCCEGADAETFTCVFTPPQQIL